ncbi:hypothetical protein [Actinoplanes solisilvae]|uniref:hypothetical protein n=1 Tax=Actinoplanes solisilvae TaxID=2486853 RepID=UPI0013E29F31|nr:hypothetical protein [Actinoplanes solisilvae]
MRRVFTGIATSIALTALLAGCGSSGGGETETSGGVDHGIFGGATPDVAKLLP